MKQKKYLISTLPEIIKISASDLHELLKKNSHCLKISTDQSGPYLDEKSFRRLIFIKQLNCGANISNKEICEFTVKPMVAEQQQEEVVGKSFIDKLSTVLNDVTDEAQVLVGLLDILATQYEQVLKELELSRSRNCTLQTKVTNLQHRQIALMGHLRQNAEQLVKEELESQLVN